MTQEEQKAFKFDAIRKEFSWSHEEWSSTWLPWVRLAVACLHQNDQELTDGVGKLIKYGDMGVLLEGLARTKMHFEALIQTVSAAQTRNFLACERMDMDLITRHPTNQYPFNEVEGGFGRPSFEWDLSDAEQKTTPTVSQSDRSSFRPASCPHNGG